MRVHFFRILSEDDLMDRIYNIMKETHVLMDLDTDLRQLLYISNIVERDKLARQKHEQMTAQTQR